jgi:hypothetical protein
MGAVKTDVVRMRRRAEWLIRCAAHSAPLHQRDRIEHILLVPGHAEPWRWDRGIVAVGDWVEPYQCTDELGVLRRLLNRTGVFCEYEDEQVICADCGRCAGTVPHGANWYPYYAVTSAGTVLCRRCCDYTGEDEM